jgi:hypothetical protein
MILWMPSIGLANEIDTDAEIARINKERAEFETEYFEIPRLQVPEMLPWPEKLSAPIVLENGAVLLPKDLGDALGSRLMDCEMLPARFVQFTVWRDQLWMAAVKRGYKVQEEELRAEIVTEMRKVYEQDPGWPTWQVVAIAVGATVLSVVIGGAIGYGIGAING